MQLKEFNVILDIKKYLQQEQFEVVQGDSFTNLVNISLVDGLNPYDLSNVNVEIAFRKSDGTTVLQSDIAIINAAQGKIQCILKTNTIASPGKVIAEVRVLEIDKLLTSARFEFFVRQSLTNDKTIESTNEFPILTQLINEVKQITAQVPEQVVTDLDNLTNYVNELAGIGRTTETVKGVADELKSHKAEKVTKVMFISRDASLVGVQAITGVGFKPKSALIFANISATVGKLSIGMCSENLEQRVLLDYQNVVANTWTITNGVVLMRDTAANGATMCSVKSFDNDGLTLDWTHAANGTTGTVTLLLLLTTH